MKKIKLPVKAFMLHETDRAWRSLRRYEHSDVAHMKCPGPLSYHNAHTLIGVVSGFTKDAEGCWTHPAMIDLVRPADDDPRWPTKCDHCAYVFTAADPRQTFDDHIWVTDEGREFSLRDPPIGALWYVDWTSAHDKGPDGRTLMAMTPGGQWCIDGQASNCTKKEDRGAYGKAHRCWVRHGTPPNVTVDKNGLTCSAGAGSIVAGTYHGFLRNGEFV